jgi:integrase
MYLNTQWKLTVRSSGKLCPWPEEAEAYVKRLGNVLEGSWSNTTSIQPVDIPTILFSFKPRSFKLSEIATDFDGLTAHCLRHTFRDRLRAVECPMDLIDQIGGWESVSSIRNSYEQGYTIECIPFIFSKFIIKLSS